MPTSLAYLQSNKNVGELFTKIATAKLPSKFTHEFLTQTIGLKGTNDRSLIPMLRTLGYIDQSGTPTAKYAELKNPAIAKSSLAAAIRKAYTNLFAADENAHLLTGDKLKGLISQVAGTDEVMTARIAQTFGALVKVADFTATAPEDDEKDKPDGEEDEEGDDKGQQRAKRQSKGLRPEFHYNIQIHLPANGTEDVYLNIFNALRKVFE